MYKKHRFQNRLLTLLRIGIVTHVHIVALTNLEGGQCQILLYSIILYTGSTDFLYICTFRCYVYIYICNLYSEEHGKFLPYLAVLMPNSVLANKNDPTHIFVLAADWDNKLFFKDLLREKPKAGFRLV